MRFNRLEIFLNILFWVLMTWLFVYGRNTMDIQAIEVINGKKEVISVRNNDKVIAFLIAQILLIILFYLEFYLIHGLHSPKAVKFFILKSIGLALSTQILILILIKAIVFPGNENVNDLSAIVPMIALYLAVAFCYGFTKKWITHEQDKRRLEFTKKQIELDLLRQQLQPHFLFNTMNNLLAMVDQHDHPKLANSIDKMSSLLRYVVYDTQHQQITIAEEITFIRNYADLHLLRYEEDEVDFNFQVEGVFDAQSIEPGILLCYVENAFKHGVQPEERAFIYIKIDLSNTDQIEFSIENSIPEYSSIHEKGGFGIKSNQERLALVYPGSHNLHIEHKKNYKVVLTIKNNESNYSG